jgi:hypothetical protein
MLSNAHFYGVKVMSGLFATKANAYLSGSGNPTSPLTNIYRDVMTNYLSGFDGMGFDMGNDIDVDTVLQGTRLMNAAVFDAERTAIDGSFTNRGNFLLFRAMSQTSTWPPGPVMFPYETVDELNIVGVPGYYPTDFGLFSEVLREAKQVQSYSWVTRPGTTPQFAGWNLLSAGTNGNKWSMGYCAILPSVPVIGGGFGEMDPPCGPYPAGGGANSPLLTLVTNLEVNSIIQDPGVIPCSVAYSNTQAEVWVRPLGYPSSGTNAVLLINASNTAQTVTVTASMLGVSGNLALTIRDPWGHATVSNFTGSFKWSIPATNSVLLTIRPEGSILRLTPMTDEPLSSAFGVNDMAIYNSNGLYLVALMNSQNNGWSRQILSTNGFDPSQVPGLAIRYDIDGMSQTVGSSITSIPDVSGRSYDQTTATGVIWTNHNGEISNKGFAFYQGGSSRSYNLSGQSFSQPVTFFFVCTLPNTPGASAGIFDGITTRENSFTITPTVYMNGGNQISFTGATTNVWQLCQFTFNGASSSVKTNTVQAVAGDVGANGLADLTLGANNVGGVNAVWKFAYLLVYTNTVSSGDATKISNWLNSRFGIY